MENNNNNNKNNSNNNNNNNNNNSNNDDSDEPTDNKLLGWGPSIHSCGFSLGVLIGLRGLYLFNGHILYEHINLGSTF